MRVEAALLVAAERVLDLVDEALVRVRTGPLGAVDAGSPELDQVVVGDQRATDGDAGATDTPGPTVTAAVAALPRESLTWTTSSLG